MIASTQCCCQHGHTQLAYRHLKGMPLCCVCIFVNVRCRSFGMMDGADSQIAGLYLAGAFKQAAASSGLMGLSSFICRDAHATVPPLLQVGCLRAVATVVEQSFRGQSPPFCSNITVYKRAIHTAAKRILAAMQGVLKTVHCFACILCMLRCRCRLACLLVQNNIPSGMCVCVCARAVAIPLQALPSSLTKLDLHWESSSIWRGGVGGDCTSIHALQSSLARLVGERWEHLMAGKLFILAAVLQGRMSSRLCDYDCCCFLIPCLCLVHFAALHGLPHLPWHVLPQGSRACCSATHMLV